MTKLGAVEKMTVVSLVVFAALAMLLTLAVPAAIVYYVVTH